MIHAINNRYERDKSQIPLQYGNNPINAFCGMSFVLNEFDKKGEGGLVRASLRHEERRFYPSWLFLLSANHTRYCLVD